MGYRLINPPIINVDNLAIGTNYNAVITVNDQIVLNRQYVLNRMLVYEDGTDNEQKEEKIQNEYQATDYPFPEEEGEVFLQFIFQTENGEEDLLIIGLKDNNVIALAHYGTEEYFAQIASEDDQTLTFTL